MENSESVRVAVNIRPLIITELLNGCTDCITVVPGEPQVILCYKILSVNFYFEMNIDVEILAWWRFSFNFLLLQL